MGTAREPVSASGRCPACSARVLKPKARSSLLSPVEILQVSGSCGIVLDCTMRDLLAPQQAVKKIGDSQLRGPGAHVGAIERVSLDSDDSTKVVPLALRRFTAEPVPVEFVEDGVLSGRDGAFNWRSERFRFRELAASELDSTVFVFREREDVKLKARCILDEVEATSP